MSFMHTTFFIFNCLLLFCFVNGQFLSFFNFFWPEEEVVYGEVTETVEPTEDFDGTDIPPDEMEDALNIDDGKYSTQEFNYFNMQHIHYDEPYFLNLYYYGGINHTALIERRCSAEYVRCIVNIEIPYPVCGFNYPANNRYITGYKTYENYCQMYLENCFMYHRRMRIVAYGECYFAGYVDQAKPWPSDHKPVS